MASGPWAGGTVNGHGSSRGTVNLSSPRAIFAGSPARFTRSRVTYEAYAVSRTSTRPQVDSAALVSLDSEAITEWAGKHGLADRSFAEIARHEKTRELIAGYIDALNAQLNRWEQINRFAIVDRELSIEAGDLTPSLKPRRKVVVENFADRLSALYNG